MGIRILINYREDSNIYKGDFMSEKIDYKIRFDEKNNRVVIPMDFLNEEDGKVYVPPHLLRQALPMPEKNEEKIAWLDQIIHEIRKE